TTEAGRELRVVALNERTNLAQTAAGFDRQERQTRVIVLVVGAEFGAAQPVGVVATREAVLTVIRSEVVVAAAKDGLRDAGEAFRTEVADQTPANRFVLTDRVLRVVVHEGRFGAFRTVVVGDRDLRVRQQARRLHEARARTGGRDTIAAIAARRTGGH